MPGVHERSVMILLYVDESGSPESPREHFVVAGVAVHEADLAKLRRQVTGILERHLDPHLRTVELHAAAILSGRGVWRSVPRATKENLLSDLCRVLANFRTATHRRFALFAVVKEPGSVPGADPMERTFEEVYLRFNGFLGRRELPEGQELGLVVADEAKYENVLQPMVREWQELGTRVGRVRQIVEVPLFVDSRATQLLQLADLVAHATWRCYERGDSALLAHLLPAFDASDEVMHGLVHLTKAHRTCQCAPCTSRRQAPLRRR